MHDMRVLTVREIRDIMHLLDQDDQHLIDLLASLTGENARTVRTWLSSGGDQAIPASLVGSSPQTKTAH
jgi:hypothetical protein